MRTSQIIKHGQDEIIQIGQMYNIQNGKCHTLAPMFDINENGLFELHAYEDNNNQVVYWQDKPQPSVYGVY